jgi:hypothetical protein
MNKRTRELAEQAGSTHKQNLGVYQFYTAELEKFAELIVRECMEQIWYTREDGINGNVSEVIKDRIKQHFGVEECKKL